MITSNTKNF